MTSKIIVNNIESDVGIGSVTFNDTISGNLEGNINSSGTSTFNVISGVSTIGVTTIHVNGINDLSYPTIGPLSNRNVIVNGSMRAAQRGISTSTIFGSTEYRTIDRFKTEVAGYTTAEGTVSQSSESPLGFSSSLRFNITSAESIAAGDLATIRYRIEGQDCQQFAYGTSNAKTLTLSFWVRSSLTGTYALSLYQPDDGRNIGLTYAVDTANTWEHKSLIIPPDTTGVIDDNNGEGFQIAWNLSVGSNYKGTDNTTWGAYSNARWATGHTVDLFGAPSNFYLTGVQLETGSVATPFEHRSYGDELLRCQRYYQKIINSSANASRTVMLGSYNTTRAFGAVPLSVPLRTNTPAFSYRNLVLELINLSNTFAVTSIGRYGSMGDRGAYMGVEANVASGLSGGTIYYLTFQGTGSYLAIDAEL